MKIKNILMGSLAAAVGAAGIISATTAQAEEFPFDPAKNQPGYWEDYFKVEGIDCKKTENPGTPYILGEPGEGLEWYAVIVKGGAHEDSHKVYYDVEAGAEIVHPSKGNSHVIACTVPVGDDEPGGEEPGEPTDPKDPEEPGDDKPEEPGKPGDDDKGDDKPGDDDKGKDKPGKPGDDDKGKDKPVKPVKPGKPGLPKTGR